MKFATFIAFTDDTKAKEPIVYKNLYPRSKPRALLSVLKHKLFTHNPYAKFKQNDDFRLDVVVGDKHLNSKKDYLCWLGHASFLLQIDGKRIITDPCLTAPPMMTRYTTLPLPIKNINPSYILVSHGHFDHLDSDTVKHFDYSKALIPLGMKKIITNINKTIYTQERDWFESYKLKEDFEIYFLPSHHWHRRTLCDTNHVLWGSYLIRTKNKNIYFAGDTAYSPHFKDIGKKFNIDIAILPIGAYEPREVMKDMHMNPQEALQTFHDLGAKEFIPMHYGTFDLTWEPMGEPPKVLKSLQDNENIHFLTIGKPYMF